MNLSIANGCSHYTSDAVADSCSYHGSTLAKTNTHTTEPSSNLSNQGWAHSIGETAIKVSGQVSWDTLKRSSPEECPNFARCMTLTGQCKLKNTTASTLPYTPKIFALSIPAKKLILLKYTTPTCKDMGQPTQGSSPGAALWCRTTNQPQRTMPSRLESTKLCQPDYRAQSRQ